MKSLFLTLAGLTLAVAAVAQNPFGGMNRTIVEGKATEKSAQTFTQERPAASGPDIMYMHDVKYETRSDTDLYLQILTPMSMADRAARPCIMYIPGSAWFKQNTYGSIMRMAEFAKRGFVVAIAEYRHSGIAPFPAQLIDMKNAIRYLRKEGARMGVDPNNIFVWGDSSGGHLSLLVGVTENVKDASIDEPDFPDVSCGVNGVIAYYPPTDLTAIMNIPDAISKGEATSPEGQLLGGKLSIAENMEAARRASPDYYVKKDVAIPPIFLAAGTMDRVVPFNQSDIMAHVLADNGKKFEFYVLPGADHGSWEFWTPAMFDKVEAFIRANVK
ncbi:MAG: alpha/beta hydrolase [Prevotellaceae bacterium]|jgi:acetyl esterase/lipase|nr:alpha/beta hydrolase [Prevotellaceae bacterium]